MSLSGAVKNLEKFLKESPTNKSALAFRLGLASTTTITQWVRTGKIPDGKVQLVLTKIKEIKKAV